MEKRESTKFVIIDNHGNVIYAGVTKNKLSQLAISINEEGYTVQKVGIRTTNKMANVWLEKYLQKYMSNHNNQLPKYNQIDMYKGISPLSITINNLGIIKEATIDLSKKLVLLCGPNNTGKTYVSYIANALLGYRGGFYNKDFSELKKLVEKQYIEKYIYKINNSHGSTVEIFPETAEILGEAVKMCEKTDKKGIAFSKIHVRI